MVGGFVLESLLGAGGMAEVYRGIDLGLEREVAVKVLPPQLAQFPIYVARFRDEARAVAALESPHIVPIYQYGEDDGLLYLVMPILADSLRGKLRREGPPPVETAVLLVAQVAEALEIAHAAGIVHRDVKPENILLDAHNRPLLSDFGIARDLTSLHAADASRTPASSGLPVGTPQYMAPEQLRQQPADQRSDVYSLGVVLYELLTGQLPHAAPSPFEVVASVLTQPVVPPSQHNPSLWPALEVVTLTALAPEPAARFLTARDFALALRATLAEANEPRDTAAEEPRLAALVASPPAAVSQTAATEPAQPVALARGTPGRRRRRRRWLALMGLAAALVVLLALTGTLVLSGGVGAPGVGLLPLPGFAAPRASPTTPGSSAGVGAPGATATPAGTPSATAGGTPSPTPGATPSPTSVPGTPSLAITPSVWQLAVDSSSGLCTSVPGDTGYSAVSQTITNNGSVTIAWQWQSSIPKLPSDFQYQLNGGLWSLAGAMPGNLLLAPSATDTLNVRLACGTSYTVTVVAHATLGSATSTYTVALRTPGLP